MGTIPCGGAQAFFSGHVARLRERERVIAVQSIRTCINYRQSGYLVAYRMYEYGLV